jgi:hypothetical protein
MGTMIDEAVDCGIVLTAFSAIVGLGAGLGDLALELGLLCLGLMVVAMFRGRKRRGGR